MHLPRRDQGADRASIMELDERTGDSLLNNNAALAFLD